MNPPGAVLLDLDGTLLDTAVELLDCVEAQCQAHGTPIPPRPALRAVVSHGAGALVNRAWSVEAGTREANRLERELLDRYERCIGSHAPTFPGMDETLAVLEAHHIPWGVFTNKPAFLTHPLLRRTGWDQRAAVVLCGDELPFAKPHPAGLFEASRALSVPIERIIMVGDAVRDIEAATRAGAPALAALFGYLHAGDHAAEWGAHGLISRPEDLLPWVERLLGVPLPPIHMPPAS